MTFEMGINFNAHGSDENLVRIYYRRRYLLGFIWACTAKGVNYLFTFVKDVYITWKS